MIFPTQVNDFTQSGGDEALVAGQLLPVPLGAREEAGDPHLSVCVSKQIYRRCTSTILYNVSVVAYSCS